jgi:NAD(P)H-dependent FMN reductase
LSQLKIFMKIAIICGSQRLNSESLRIANFTHELLKNTHPELEYFFLDLPKEDLPRLHSYQSTVDETWRHRWLPISEELKSSDAFVIISPEWNGGATPTIKNFFLLCSNFELYHKPALLVCTSTGHGGSFPISELRAYTYKNTQINYIPEHIIIRSCEDLLREQELLPTNTKADVYIKKRLKFATNLLVDYAKCMKPLRANGIPQFELSPYGMS